MIRPLPIILLCLLWIASCAPPPKAPAEKTAGLEAPPAELQGTDGLGREYWVYLPANFDPSTEYTLVVGVHGYGGNGRGAGGLAGWVAERDDVIVVGPSFPNDGYQVLDRRSGEQLVELFASLKTQFRLRAKLFIAGFSGGAQFSHRFTIRHPSLVAGCAAHSGGSWAVGGHATMFGRSVSLMEPSTGAASVPMAISCGQDDFRLVQTRKFESLANANKYTLIARYWRGVGHEESEAARRMTAECLVIAVGAAANADRDIAKAEETLAEGRAAEAIAMLETSKATPVPPSALGTRFAQRLSERLTARIDAIVEAGVKAAEQATDTKTLRALGKRYAGVERVERAVGAALRALD